ncbi:MAG: hypothetical protein RIS75_93 [Actinomycetota bacterium]
MKPPRLTALSSLGLGLLILTVSLSGGGSAMALGSAEPAIWPVRAQILRLPVIPYPNWKPGHRGLDVAADIGTLVRSPVFGRVVWVGDINHIPMVTIQSRAGFRHTVLPVTTALEVGDRISQREVVGVVELSDHCLVGNCLHWGIKKDGQYYDPRWFLPAHIFRLPPR